MTDDRSTVDPEQWRALMALPDETLLEVWRTARADYETARSQAIGLDEAASWLSVIEGAAASRFGVGRHIHRYNARYP